MWCRVLLLAVIAAVWCCSDARIFDKHVSSRHKDGNITRSARMRRDSGTCGTPTKKAKVDLPDSMYNGPRPLPYDMYSGYVGVTPEDFLFYWYFSNQNKSSDAPLIIWTNGGPGCTSMEGATTEISPLSLFRIKIGGDLATGKFSDNPFAWNKYADILFIDNPRQVGFSFGPTKVRSSVAAADDIIVFLKGWFDLFPELVGRDIYIAGESYAGHYLPAWASKIMDHNDRDNSPPLNLKGILIGNGCISDTQDTVGIYSTFAKEQNIMPEDARAKSIFDADAIIQKKLGYTPNYYDYRVRDLRCSGCYSFDYGPWGKFFLRPDVTKALHICTGSGTDSFANDAGGCISVRPFDSSDSFDYVGALGRALDRGIRLLMMYGKNDMACNYVGGRMIADNIPWKYTNEFAETKLSPLRLDNRELGQLKSYGPLTFFQIENAGHMVPLDNPIAAALGIDYLMGVTPIWSPRYDSSDDSDSEDDSNDPECTFAPVYSVDSPIAQTPGNEAGSKGSSAVSGALIACIVIIGLLSVIVLFGAYKWYTGSLILLSPVSYKRYEEDRSDLLAEDEIY